MNALLSFLGHLTGREQCHWRPLLSVYYLTYQCGFRCWYCSDGAGRPYPVLRSPTLPAEQVLRLLQVVRRYCASVVLTGGEPLEYPEFDALMPGLAALRFRHVILTTNGFELDRHLASAAEVVTELVISLDTLDAAKADACYGVGPGALRRILANLEQARTWAGRRFDLLLSSVVTPENLVDLYAVQQFAAARGYKFAACPQLVGVKAHPELADNPEYRRFYDHLIREKRRGARVHGTVDYLEYLRDLRKFTCRPLTMLVLSPAGEVFYPCLELGQFAGNLLEQGDLDQILARGRARHGPLPHCDNRCHSACALGFARLLDRPSTLLHEAWLEARYRWCFKRGTRCAAQNRPPKATGRAICQ